MPEARQLHAIRAVIRRDYAITRSYPLAMVTELLFGALNLGAYFFISRTFHDMPAGGMHGASTYFAFAAVGVAITVVIQGATAGVSSRIREEQLTGTLEALVAHPVRSAELSLGLAGFPFLFGMTRAIFYLLIALPWMHVDASRVSWLGVALALAVTATALTGIGIAMGALVLIFRRGGTLALASSFVLGVLGGALFPVAVLPSWLQTVAQATPTKASFDAVRAALFQGDGWGAPAGALVVFSAFTIPLAVALFGAALEINRRRGALSQY